MKTAYIDLVRFVLKQNMTVSVWDGEEWQVIRSKKFREIVSAVQSVEEATLKIRDESGAVMGKALVSPYGLEPDETVIDWTDNEFMEGWYTQYEAML